MSDTPEWRGRIVYGEETLDALRSEIERLWVLLDLAAHTIIDHQCKEISASWCRDWEKRYRQLAADRDGAANG